MVKEKPYMSEFNKGDIVKFKSGRRKMQIYEVYDDGNYTCEWETETGYETADFSEFQIELVKEKNEK